MFNGPACEARGSRTGYFHAPAPRQHKTNAMPNDPRPSLSYDTLPRHATISVSDDGETITLTAPAREDAGHQARRRLARSSALSAGVYSAGVLMLIGALSYGVIRANWAYIPGSAAPLAGIFVLALFALLWQSVYRKQLDAVVGPLQQTTIVAVRPQRLLIETYGPMGVESHDLTRTQVRDIKLLLDVRDGSLGDETMTDWLTIFTHDGQMVRLLPARDREELKWVGRLLRKTLGIEPADAV